MKKLKLELNSIFCINEEMRKDNGEDCFYYEAQDDSFVIAAFDGLGGAGGKKYSAYLEKTGAYIASRAVSGGVGEWFLNSKKESELKNYIKRSLSVCQSYEESKQTRLKGSLSKAFPTTAAIICGEVTENGIEAHCYWAGDSRCYILNSKGLHQLTEDDLDGQDAMSNLTNDGVMTNVICADADFEIHSKRLIFEEPCILLTATDGSFGYLKSPMEFEYLITDTLCTSRNIFEWKMSLNEKLYDVTGDDYTLCIAVFGFNNFDEIKKYFMRRNDYVKETYINSQKNLNELWNNYKKEYSIFI